MGNKIINQDHDITLKRGMQTHRILIVLLFGFATGASSVFGFSEETQSEAKKTLMERIPREILGTKNNFLALTIENDSLGNGADKNYTSGVRLSYLNTQQKPIQLIKQLDKTIPLFAFNDTTAATYSLGQNLYTPDNITTPNQVPGTRPWAAFLYGSVGLSTVIDNYVDDMELTAGVVGPWAQGEESQKYIHSLIDGDDAKGWSNQIDTEPGFILSWKRRWPQLLVHEWGDFVLSIEPNAGGSIGNVYTLAETGLILHLTPSADRWQDTPLLVRPSIPGSGFFQSKNRGIGWYFFSGAQGRAIARNIFLDGNTFENSYDVDKKNFVVDFNAGIALTIKDVRLSYTLIYRSKEFKSQLDDSFFGAASVGYRF